MTQVRDRKAKPNTLLDNQSEWIDAVPKRICAQLMEDQQAGSLTGVAHACSR
jgi:hypothetical protein